MNLNEWAIRWGVPIEALIDLKIEMGINDKDPIDEQLINYQNETSVNNLIRKKASEQGWRLWRNNVGVLKDVNGRPVRYGLANDSKRMNKAIKSSDLIGIGNGGQFIARECKAPGWSYSGTEREQAQLKFINLINALGGDAKFTTGEL